ncbi:MAG: hypothetical protein DMC59_05810 [Verrucomicrobia bacterium]|nr:MAG: hypothetical protein DMC59_05810 [Verrucomicrobiota bacterium]
MSDEPKQWWQTFPAITGGVATILTALTGLIVALNQIGIFKPAEKKPSPSPEPSKEAILLAIVSPAPAAVERLVATPTIAAAVPLLATATPFVAVAAVPPSLTPVAHYRATERKDLEYLLSQYDDIVNYLGEVGSDKASIRNGYLNYFRRWPVTSFTIGDIRVVRSFNQDIVTAYFDIRFSVQDIASGRYKTGRASEEWVLSKSSGTLKMISEKETVHSDPTDRRRNNR